MAKGEDRYKKPDPAKMQDKAEAGAEKKAETSKPPMDAKAAGKEADKPSSPPIAGGTLSAAFVRHQEERQRMHTRHEGEHKEMNGRHMKELGGMLSSADVTGASGVGGPGGEGVGA